MSLYKYVDKIKNKFHEFGNPAVAQQKISYMKDQFDFYGLRAKKSRDIARAIFKEEGYLIGNELNSFVRICYEDEYREMHYTAIEMVEIQIKKVDSNFINTLEWMITHQSWWDTVDWIAKLVGFYFERFPEQLITTTERWLKSDNMWLQRVSIIFQLKYRDKTNQNLLFRYCQYKASDKEFFIRKAIGWALRQYSRTAPDAVINFVKTHKDELSPLSKKEALRLVL